jgi:acyl-CoA thioester hydrolase
MAGVEQHIAYKRELFAGDVVFIRSQVMEVREKVLRISHQMINSESQEVAATTELTAVHIDRSARRAYPLPAAVLQRAKELAARAQR